MKGVKKYGGILLLLAAAVSVAVAGATLAWFFVGYWVYVLFAPPETAVAFGLISLLSLLLALVAEGVSISRSDETVASPFVASR